jgi:hypothetical protein
MLFKLWNTIDRSNTNSFCAIIVYIYCTYIHTFIHIKSNQKQKIAADCCSNFKIDLPNVQLLQRLPYKGYSRF